MNTTNYNIISKLKSQSFALDESKVQSTQISLKSTKWARQKNIWYGLIQHSTNTIWRINYFPFVQTTNTAATLASSYSIQQCPKLSR